jgi:hypothetical protein
VKILFQNIGSSGLFQTVGKTIGLGVKIEVWFLALPITYVIWASYPPHACFLISQVNIITPTSLGYYMGYVRWWSLAHDRLQWMKTIIFIHSFAYSYDPLVHISLFPQCKK